MVVLIKLYAILAMIALAVIELGQTQSIQVWGC